ncbi:MAG: fibrobacter succinogenes major paralogous domain-containing protein, partial [Fibromonadales bacterium]|nr:fibrobacter succinogenes major paralogous domain-containing protein [Fibromonadales bacterium]
IGFILLIGGIGVQTFSCSSVDIEPPPPPSAGENSSSSGLQSSSSSDGVSSSSSIPSGSVFCQIGIVCSVISIEACTMLNGVEVPSCETLSSSSDAFSSSSDASSSSANVGTGLCEGFVEGTLREHYGKDKPQFCDERDGQKYVYVTIGEQTWMAENLNYDASGSVCYGDNLANCNIYGRLYNWSAAIIACPPDWHLSSYIEWTDLTDYVGADAMTKLKAVNGWEYQEISGNGTDNYGFSALPGGERYASGDICTKDGAIRNSNGDFCAVNTTGFWWSATELNTNIAYRKVMFSVDEAHLDYHWKTYSYYVRCVKD